MSKYFAPIKYTFKNRFLLIAALTHKSSAVECSLSPDTEGDNQRLEFLGDAVLDLIISRYLFEVLPKLSEGSMSRVRACLVCESTLADIARSIDLGRYLVLSLPEDNSGGRDKSSLLADALEAVLGAVYMDGGHDVTQNIIYTLWAPYLTFQESELPLLLDYKSSLQEYTQRRGMGLPCYQLSNTKGPAHKPTFFMSVHIGNYPPCIAMANSKKQAAQLAAKALLEELMSEENNSWDKNNNSLEEEE
jgi:ribonuclease-3